jgi:hypothetical protein
MKKVKLLLLALGLSLAAQAQTTGTDFSSNDCAGNNHQLFAELNDGKVVILCWVMPCIHCVDPALAASAVVKSYDSLFPGKVVFYMLDDYGNSNCSALQTWADENGITPNAMFSNSSISMSAYGSAGMPKTVVLAGNEHKVHLNNNGDLNYSMLKNAVSNALVTANASTLDLYTQWDLSPNPSADHAVQFRCAIPERSEFFVEILEVVRYWSILFARPNTLAYWTLHWI